MIKNNNIVLSQSITKDLGLFIIDDQLEEIEFCPKQIYHKHIADDYEREPSKAMLEGLYAETRLYGSCARGEEIRSLQKKKNGEETITQKRIDIQVERMYGYMYAHGIEIKEHNVQVPLIAKYADGVWIRGELDMFPVYVDNEPSIVDFKTTKDVNNSFFTYKEDLIKNCVNSCWGNKINDFGDEFIGFNYISKNQPLMYHFLARNYHKTGLDTLKKYKPEKSDTYTQLFNIDKQDYNFWFYVSGTGKPDLSNQLRRFEYRLTSHRESLLDMLVMASIKRIRESLKNGWQANKKDGAAAQSGEE